MAKTDTQNFTPALGRTELTSDYDRVIAVMTRERRWRGRMLAELSPKAGNTIIDLGSGTGTFAIMIKEACPRCRVVALDPDPDVRKIAEDKAHGNDIAFITAMGDAPLDLVPNNTADIVTCSLVLHQCPMKMKTGILANAYRLLRPGGRVLVSDYGEQRTLLMRMLFKQVRELDGYENTKPNKDGLIPELIEHAGFERVEERKVTLTPTGSISLYSGWKDT